VIPGYDDGFANTSSVGSFAANRFGLFDMGGNVWQWCEDWHSRNHVDHVLRGASWGNSERRRLLSSHRYQYTPGFRSNLFGFRCVVGASAR
jgi:formylglycine-generating enzyme required for sulfatase activity